MCCAADGCVMGGESFEKIFEPVRKALASAGIDFEALCKCADLAEGDLPKVKDQRFAEKIDRLIHLVMATNKVDRNTATRWVGLWLKSQGPPANAQREDSNDHAQP